MKSKYFYSGVVVLGFILSYVVFWSVSSLYQGSGPEHLLFLSGGGMKAPVSEIAHGFEQETGIKVMTRYEGSASLRQYIARFQVGDVFLPGDKGNLDILSAKGLVEAEFFMAYHRVALFVAPHMKGKINSLDDLAADGVRLVMSNPELASLGRLVMEQIIAKHPRGEDILKNIVVYGSSSQDVLDIYRSGGIDAIIEWDVLAQTLEGEGLTLVPLAGSYEIKDRLVVGLLTTSGNQVAARRFYEYLSGEGRRIFKAHGYDTEE